MVGALTLVAVREQQHDSRVLTPLLFGGRDELVDDRLSAIHEVAELGFPQNESVGVPHRVAVFVGQCCVFRQERVVDVKTTLVFGEVHEREPFLAVFAVVEHRVALHERSATCVLAYKPDLLALDQQRPQCEQLAEAPIDFAIAAHVCALGQQLFQFRVHREAVRYVSVSVPNPMNHGWIHRGRRGVSLRLFRHRGPARPIRGIVVVFRVGECVLQQRKKLSLNGRVFVGRDVTAAHQRLRVEGSHRALGLDEVVHEGLCHRRVVTLVVPATSVTHDVNHDVVFELLTVTDRHLGDANNGLGVVPVDVEDRCLNRSRDVGGIQRRSRISRHRRETDLIVRHDVDGSTGAVAAKLRHLQRLQDDSLTCHRGVSVNENGKHGERPDGFVVLFCPNNPFENAVDRFQVGRVRREVHRDFSPLRGDKFALRAEVVLHVTRTLDGARVGRPLEFAENLPVGFSRDIREDVETPTVGHSDVNLVESEIGRILNDFIEQSDYRFAPLERKALLTDKFGLQERLERLSLIQFVEDTQLFVVRRFLIRLFEHFLEPLALFRVLKVRVFDADSATVRITQQSEYFTQ